MTKIAEPTTKARPVARKRVPFWDNARFVCVLLVVVGHGIQRMTYESNNALVLYLFIYAFHMPAFAIISGYFSKASPPNSLRMRRLITDVLLPYFIMETIWTLVQFLVEGKDDFNPSEPSWTLWFLLALGLFRLILPYLALMKWPLLWALILSIGVGYLSNVDSTFSLSRAIGILPFFLLGWKVRQWGLVDRWRVMDKQAWFVRGAAVAVFAAWLLVVVVFIQTWRDIDLRFWFFYDDSYQGLLGDNPWWAGLVRLGLIVLAVVLSAAFFVLMPRSQTWMTPWGQATMYIYLLHSFVLYPIRETGILLDEHSSASWLLSMVLACIAISIVLASSFIRRLFRPLVQPRASWLFIALEEPEKSRPRPDATGSRREP
jgi:fucose 4-O-acetylase-like acetyltransferase